MNEIDTIVANTKAEKGIIEEIKSQINIVDRIKDIQRRLNATTKGKWIVRNVPYDECNDPYIETEDGTYIAQTTYDMQSKTENHNINADTEFIAHAKEDIEYLLKLIGERF